LLRPWSRPAIASSPRRWPAHCGAKGVDLSGVKGSGPNGRIVKADVEGASPARRHLLRPRLRLRRPLLLRLRLLGACRSARFGIPHEDQPLSSMRKTIARRLTESKQQVPHIYLTVDVRLDALLKLRAE
jgi:pyruvate dehydrogenase E2 component (dihydrolipoamide acetyltransferase)